MNTINLDTEVVASSYDATAQTYSYTFERAGRRWTVTVPHAALAQHGPNVQARRNHLGNLLTEAMRGPADGER